MSIGNVWQRYGWTLLFCIACALAYSQAVREKKKAICNLSLRLIEVEQEKAAALQQQEELRLRLACQADPGWIEMVLMRELGVVPEGFLKVHFSK